MNAKTHRRFSPTVFFLLLSLFLIGAGISRWLETDSGKILVHDISIESYEGFFYGARLFRPLQASSMNQRPSVLLVFGDTADRYTGDHIAMELARRGFVALTMEDFGHGNTEPIPDFETENLVDTGYSFLATRSFTDHSRIGLTAFYEGAEKALVSRSFSEFTSRIFISPTCDSAANSQTDTRIFTAKYETDPKFIFPGGSEIDITEIPVGHSGMLISSQVISGIMELFHEDLAIPNDTPFWFDSTALRAQVLIAIRGVLLVLLFIICVAFSAMMTGKVKNNFLKTVLGILLPLILFLSIEELMNFFLISVRIGSPFHYLPNLKQAVDHFSLQIFIAILAAALIWSIPLGRSLFVSDCLAVIGICICLFAFLPFRLTGSAGCLMPRLFSIKCLLIHAVFYSIINSLLIRFPERDRIPGFCTALLNGIMFYFASSGLLIGSIL